MLLLVGRDGSVLLGEHCHGVSLDNEKDRDTEQVAGPTVIISPIGEGKALQIIEIRLRQG